MTQHLLFLTKSAFIVLSAVQIIWWKQSNSHGIAFWNPDKSKCHFNVLLKGQSYLWCWNNNQHYYWEVCFKSSTFAFNMLRLFLKLYFYSQNSNVQSHIPLFKNMCHFTDSSAIIFYSSPTGLYPPGSMDDHILLLRTSSSLGSVVVLPSVHWGVLFSIYCVLDIVKLILKYRENIFFKNKTFSNNLGKLHILLNVEY